MIEYCSTIKSEVVYEYLLIWKMLWYIQWKNKMQNNINSMILFSFKIILYS